MIQNLKFKVQYERSSHQATQVKAHGSAPFYFLILNYFLPTKLLKRARKIKEKIKNRILKGKIV
jgi:hypothetical protein